MGLKPKSSWPKSLHQPHYTCEMCGGPLVQTCELQFDAGAVEPAVGETLTGATSGDTGKVVSVTVDSGSWLGDDAAGTIYLSTITGVSDDYELFQDDELVTGSVGGAGMLTVNGDGIVKTEGLVYPEGQTGIFEGKRYCTEHLNFKLGKGAYDYRLNIGD